MEVGNSGMTTFRGARALAAAAMVMAALTSCTDEGQDPAASGTPSPSSPAPTTSSSTPPSDSEIASEAASAVVRKYFKTVDLVRQDSNRPASELERRGVELAAHRSEEPAEEPTPGGPPPGR